MASDDEIDESFAGEYRGIVSSTANFAFRLVLSKPKKLHQFSHSPPRILRFSHHQNRLQGFSIIFKQFPIIFGLKIPENRFSAKKLMQGGGGN